MSDTRPDPVTTPGLATCDNPKCGRPIVEPVQDFDSSEVYCSDVCRPAPEHTAACRCADCSYGLFAPEPVSAIVNKGEPVNVVTVPVSREVMEESAAHVLAHPPEFPTLKGEPVNEPGLKEAQVALAASILSHRDMVAQLAEARRGLREKDEEIARLKDELEVQREATRAAAECGLEWARKCEQAEERCKAARRDALEEALGYARKCVAERQALAGEIAKESVTDERLTWLGCKASEAQRIADWLSRALSEPSQPKEQPGE